MGIESIYAGIRPFQTGGGPLDDFQKLTTLQALLDDRRLKQMELGHKEQMLPLQLDELRLKNAQHKQLSDIIQQAYGEQPTAGSPSVAGGAAPDGFERELRQAQALGLVDPARGRAAMEALKLKYPDLKEHQGVLYKGRTGEVVRSMPFSTAAGSSIQVVRDETVPGGFRIVSPAGANEALREQTRIKAEEEARLKPYERKPTGPDSFPTVEPLLDVLRPKAPTPQSVPPDAPIPGTPGPSLGAIPPQVQTVRDRERLNILYNERAAKRAMGATDPALDAEIANVEKQLGVSKAPGSGQAPANAIGPSPRVEAQIAADKEFQVGDAKWRQENYAEMQKRALANQGKIAKLERVGALLGDFDGGKLAQSGFELSRLGTSLGVTIDPKLPNKEAAVALSNAIALDLRNTGEGSGMPGALSDADREFLRSMSPQLGQTAEGRRKIIESHVGLMRREQAIADMARRYRAKHGTIDEAFYSQLQQWSNRNPVFRNAN